MLAFAIITPTAAALYLVWQIHKRDLRSWQHYACLTSLVFLISILFLVGSGQVESFGLAGNTVKVVDQRLTEIKRLTEQNQILARMTAELAALMAKPTMRIGTVDILSDWEAMRERMSSLLKQSGASDSDILKTLKRVDDYIAVLRREEKEQQ